MTRLKLLLRNLSYFRAANLAVVAGMAVATAVLTGALMVGDSVRGSLRDLAEQRLGPVDYVLAGGRFVRDDLPARLAKADGFADRFSEAVAGISVRGGAANGSDGLRTAGVQIAAIDRWIPVSPAHGRINRALADAIGVEKIPATLLLSLPAITDIPRDAALSRRSLTDITSGLQPAIERIEAHGMPALFDLAGSQRTPLNAWVNLKDLQDAVGQTGRANLILVSSKGHVSDAAGADQLNALLHRLATPEDYGLEIGKSRDGAEAIISFSSTYLLPEVDRAATDAAKIVGVLLRRVLVYLVNNVVLVGPPEKTIHYAIAAGIDPLDGGELKDDEVALNQWTADQLGAKLGDRLRLDYYQRQPNGDLSEVRSDREGLGLTFRVARILPMVGLGADPTLTPQYKGLTDTDSVADWSPPEGLKIDKSLVTKPDEAYWKEHRASPKVFLSLAAARRMWGNVYGNLNSIRVPADRAAAFTDDLIRRIDPARMGLAFMPIKGQQLAAASGSTDFARLFIGFSFFLIASAIMLVAMLFRLGIEQRARQFGLMGAVGFSPGRLMRLALAEGMVLAVIGGLIGVGGAIGYTWLMVAGLRTWWVGAIGTTALQLHVEPATLASGFVGSLIIAMLAVTWGAGRLRKAQAATLLAGGWTRETPTVKRRGSLGTILSAVGLAAGLAVLILGMRHAASMQNAFMAGGAILLISGLSLIAVQMKPALRQTPSAGWSVARLAWRNAARHRGRSIMTMALIAFASFILVTVSSMKQPAPPDTHDKSAGTGGYQLIVQADMPLLGDLNTKSGRDLVGVRDSDAAIWRTTSFTPLRVWAGQDISCLNITRPTSPTILSVPPSMQQRNAFTFPRTIRKLKNPWELLDLPLTGENAIPVIADDETAQYILHLALGESLTITDQLGRERKLTLVATLAHSIFQGELLMSEANFQRLFPAQSGGTLLVETDDRDAARKALAAELEDYSVTIERTGDRLARYQEVANTYLSTFQTLGSLGLLLGTIGLAVILLRSVIERRGELALLSAIGFAPSRRRTLVMAENLYLLMMGLAVGAGCAIIGVLPTILASHRNLNWLQLVLSLVTVLETGVIALFVAMSLAGRYVTAQDLRRE